MNPALADQTALLQDLLITLQQERTALEESNFESLADSTDRKNQLIADVNRFVSEAPKLDPKTQKLIDACNQANKFNGLLINKSIQSNQAALSVLNIVNPEGSTYDESGNNANTNSMNLDATA